MASIEPADPETPGNEPALPGLRVFVSYPRGGATHAWAEKVHADLEARGAEVFRDESSVDEGDDWYVRIRDGLERADVVACIVGADTEGSKWQRREMLRADQLALPVVAFRTVAVGLPFYMQERQPVELRDPSVPAASFARLAHALAKAAARRATAPPAAAMKPQHPDGARREREQAYLTHLLYRDLSTHETQYEPLAAHFRESPSLARSHKGLRIDTHLVLRAFGQQRATVAPPPERTYTDVLDAYRALPGRRIRRLAVLGEPGAGKSFSLERIACDYARRALHDAAAPVPVLVGLGLWTKEAEPLQVFIERQLGDLGRDVGALRDGGRAVLLLDGMNEIPPQQRLHKVKELRAEAEDERYAAVVVSCRERDFGGDCALPFDTLTLQPLSPTQIHRFLQRAYALQAGDERGRQLAEQRFWQLAGGEAVCDLWLRWQAAGASFELFWSADEVPRENPNVFRHTTAGQDRIWRETRDDTRSLIRLCRQPLPADGDDDAACRPAEPGAAVRRFPEGVARARKPSPRRPA